MSGGAPRTIQYETNKGQAIMMKAGRKLVQTKCGNRGQKAFTARGTAERPWYKKTNPMSLMMRPNMSFAFMTSRNLVVRVAVASLDSWRTWDTQLT